MVKKIRLPKMKKLAEKKLSSAIVKAKKNFSSIKMPKEPKY